MARCIPCRIIIIDGGKVIGKLTTVQALMAGLEEIPSAESEPVADCLADLDTKLDALIAALEGSETGEIPGL